MKEQIMATLKPKDIFEYYGIPEQKNKYLCPFHHDTHPSVSTKGDLWRCWVCQDKSQNIIDFVMLHEGVNYSDALDILCEIASIDNKKEIKKHTNWEKKIQDKQKEIIFASNAKKFEFCTIDKQELKKLEYEKEIVLQNLLNDNEYLDREFEKVGKNCGREITQFESKRYKDSGE